MTRYLLPATALLAALSGMPAAGQAGRQEPRTLERTVTRVVRLNYLLALPQDYGKEADRKWPLLLFLHGSGETGADLEMVKKHGPPKLLAAGKELPMVVVSPQAPVRGWDPFALGALLDEIEEKHAIDRDRVCVTGLSMGGYGTWDLAAAFPNRFAAIVPICGGGSPRRARTHPQLATWVFHGGKDTVVPPSESEAMVDALKGAGGSPKYTVYPDAEHDSWTATYDNPAVWEWLLAQKRQPARERR